MQTEQATQQNQSEQVQAKSYFREDGSIDESAILGDDSLWGSSSSSEQESKSEDVLAEIVEENKEQEEVVAPKEEAKSNDKLSSRLAILAKKEAKILAREKELNSKVRELEARSKSFEGINEDDIQDAKDFKKILNEAKYDKAVAVDILERLGITIEDLKATASVGDSSRELAKLRKKFDEQQDLILKLKQDSENKFNEFVSKQSTGRIDSIKSNIKSIAQSNSDKYDLLLANEGFTDDVLSVQKEYYNMHGQVLDTETAMEEVQKFYEERLKETLGKSKRFSSIFNQQASNNTTSANGIKTLNSDSLNQRKQKNLDEMTDAEREAFAMSIMNE